ncbi:hypothetical protein C8R43DRAFT_955842 [Mycena crocata]|nr:hypothetical protein C8R43DRAFT_955842 [Mycena crocata]
MLRFPISLLLAVLATSILTVGAAPLRFHSTVVARAENASEFAAACTAAGIAGGLTTAAASLLEQIKRHVIICGPIPYDSDAVYCVCSNDQGVTDQLQALKALLAGTLTAGGEVGAACKALGLGADNAKANAGNSNEANKDNINSAENVASSAGSAAKSKETKSA